MFEVEIPFHSLHSVDVKALKARLNNSISLWEENNFGKRLSLMVLKNEALEIRMTCLRLGTGVGVYGNKFGCKTQSEITGRNNKFLPPAVFRSRPQEPSLYNLVSSTLTVPLGCHYLGDYVLSHSRNNLLKEGRNSKSFPDFSEDITDLENYFLPSNTISRIFLCLQQPVLFSRTSV